MLLCVNCCKCSSLCEVGELTNCPPITEAKFIIKNWLLALLRLMPARYLSAKQVTSTKQNQVILFDYSINQLHCCITKVLLLVAVSVLVFMSWNVESSSWIMESSNALASGRRPDGGWSRWTGHCCTFGSLFSICDVHHYLWITLYKEPGC